ncbi:hypothetical protein [Hyphomicrobium sp.]|uniref:hypothetical protein n=1 Tax=Hyphomicrobium sp. TaxID=82 RepID=UPI000FA9E8E4|nr:hypothetical protein [Hyphomicrobium sp.]RUP10733.1 MAG: hypothetical protein EKK38_04265 [Hyphomicrobium sp.]
MKNDSAFEEFDVYSFMTTTPNALTVFIRDLRWHQPARGRSGRRAQVRSAKATNWDAAKDNVI